MRILGMLVLWLGLLAAASVAATELVDAEVVAGGSPALENASGTLRLEDGRLGRVGVEVMAVPEPGVLWQLGTGAGLLALLARRRRRARQSSFGLLATALLALPALAQVPQDTTFTGRLVDGAGNPLAGPVDLELRIFDADTGGTLLYSEQHLGTTLNATGGFSVQLGLGTSPSGSYDADLFSATNRWLEVAVGTEVLTPRQIVGSVPWALVAERANEVVRDPSAPRFEDCGDGTVADHRTGLQWEKKTGTFSPTGYIICENVSCPDPHHVNNTYGWSASAPYESPDGAAFTDFLSKLNDQTRGDVSQGSIYTNPPATGCFAGHCDWRLPIIDELGTIMIGTDAAPGQSTSCSFTCTDPDFAAVAGSIANDSHFSASTVTGTPTSAWRADYLHGLVAPWSKTSGLYVRAVRVGSCR